MRRLWSWINELTLFELGLLTMALACGGFALLALVMEELV